MDTVKDIDPVHAELVGTLQGKGVEYTFGSFIDITGRAKAKCVPVAHLPALLAGHERYTPAGWAISA